MDKIRYILFAYPTDVDTMYNPQIYNTWRMIL